jgi:hypothetical protein
MIAFPYLYKGIRIYIQEGTGAFQGSAAAKPIAFLTRANCPEQVGLS